MTRADIQADAAAIRPARRPVIAFILLALLFAVLYGRYLLGWAPSGGDIYNQYIPYQQLVRDAVRQGELPLWNAMTFCGRPLMADIQVGVLYPPNWLHWALPAPLPFTFALVLALHGAWMILGCWRLGRHWNLTPPAIVLGTTLFCASPFFTLKLLSGVVLFIYAGAWWPWLALGVSRLVERASFGRAAVLALALALSLLAGAPQITFYGWIAVAALGIALPGTRRDPATDPVASDEADDAALRTPAARTPAAHTPPLVGWARRLPWLALAFALAMGLTAIQTFQTAWFVGQSFERGGAGADWDYITKTGSFAPRLLWLLVNPGLLGETVHQDEYYWGKPPDYAEGLFYTPLWVLTILLPLGFWATRRLAEIAAAGNPAGELALRPGRARLHARLGWLALAAALLGCLLAMGEHSPLFRLAYLFAPGFNRFRVPARLMLFFTAGGALLAALAVDRLLTRGVRPRRAVAALLAGFALALLLVWVPFAFHDPLWRALDAPMYQHGRVINPPAYKVQVAFALLSGMRVTIGVLLALAIGAFAGLPRALARARGRDPGAAALAPAAWALAPIAALELALLAAPFVRDTRVAEYAQVYYPQTNLVRALRAAHDPARGGRILWLDDVISWQNDQNQPEIYPNRLVMHGLPDARGYDPVNARWIGEWMNLLGGYEPERNPGGFMFVPIVARPAWLPLMGVETVLSYRDLGAMPGLEAGARLSFPEGPLTLWRNTRFQGVMFAAPAPGAPPVRAPTAWQMLLYGSAIAADRPEAEPRAAATAEPTSAERDGALARAIDGRFRVEPLPPRPNRFACRVEFPEPALLVLAQSAWDGWLATVDGRPVATRLYCGAFQAVDVPAGPHEVVFDFAPPAYMAGKAVSLGALVVLLYGLARAALLARRRTAEPHPAGGPRHALD